MQPQKAIGTQQKPLRKPRISTWKRRLYIHATSSSSDTPRQGMPTWSRMLTSRHHAQSTSLANDQGWCSKLAMVTGQGNTVWPKIDSDAKVWTMKPHVLTRRRKCELGWQLKAGVRQYRCHIGAREPRDAVRPLISTALILLGSWKHNVGTKE
jgi:hypothetical protein